MGKIVYKLFGAIIIIFYFFILVFGDEKMRNKEIKLPEPVLKGKISLEETIYKRRSIRNFKEGVLTLNQVSQLLWAAQGITDKERGFRAAPSAGATYPMEIYLFVGNVQGLIPGIYKYNPFAHSIVILEQGDKRKELRVACLNQETITMAQIVIVVTAVFERTTKVYGNRGVMYVYMEAGHIGQNIYLQAETLNLGTVAIGAFRDDEVKKILKLSDKEHPLYIFPVGIKK